MGGTSFVPALEVILILHSTATRQKQELCFNFVYLIIYTEVEARS